MQTLLTVAAHPDDASIFWGGTIAKHVAEGWAVISVTVDEGRGSPHSFTMSGDELVATRRRELGWESLRLGATMAHLALPGVKTSEHRATALSRLTALIREHRPARLIAHHLDDSHATHVTVSRLTLAAAAAAAEHDAELPEVWCADGWEPVHFPDVRVDVTPYMNLKMAAISQHGSQIFDTPYVMGAWGLALYRAGFAASHEVTDPTCLFAEAFVRIAPEDLRAVVATLPLDV